MSRQARGEVIDLDEVEIVRPLREDMRSLPPPQILHRFWLDGPTGATWSSDSRDCTSGLPELRRVSARKPLDAGRPWMQAPVNPLKGLSPNHYLPE